MGYSIDQYREQLKALLPPGRAFPRERGTTLDALLDAMAQELARLDGRAERLASDAVPSSTAELLTDWERTAGLPDNCSGLLSETLQGRRGDVVSKLTGRGGQSPAYFIALANAIGFDVKIDEFRPFRAGSSRAGDSLTNGDWRFTWRIRAPEVTVRRFRAGISAAGERLATWGNAGLECRIRQYAPAHTNLIIAYGMPDYAVLLTPDGTPLSIGGGLRLLVRGSFRKSATLVPPTVVQVAPANVVPPTITGGNTVGSTLTCDPGAWVGEPVPTLALQWQRVVDGGYVDIIGATDLTYVTESEGAHRCQVIGTNAVDAIAAYSNAINIGTTQIAPSMVTAPIISGNAYAGSTLYALPGDWAGTAPIAFAYQWQVQDPSTLAWNTASGASTADSYVTPSAGVYRCLVTATNTGGPVSAPSNAMSVSALSAAPALSKRFTGAATDNLAVTTYDSTLTYFPNPNVTENLVIHNATSSVHAGNTGGSLQAVYPNTRTFGLRQKVTATVYQTDTTSQIALVLRFVDYDNMLLCYLGGAGSTLVQKIGGVSTSYPLGTSVAAGDVIACEINEAGTVVQVKVNDVHTSGGTWPSPITLTSAQPATGTLAGAGLWGTTSAELSSFTDFTVDDFSLLKQAPTLDYAPQIRGAPTVNATLTATRGVWFATPEPTYAWLWQMWNGTAWVTAPGTSNTAEYVPTSNGDYRCRVTATNTQGAATATSPTITVTGGSVGTGTYTQARIVIDETQGAPSPMVGTLAVRATVGGTALTGTAFASSEAGALSTAAKAFDGDADTFWQPALGASPHLGLTFASATAIAEIAITFPAVEAQFTESALRTFRLQGWDGAQWTTLKTITDAPAWAPGETRTYTV